MPTAAPTTRPITDDELPDFLRVVGTAMLSGPPSPEMVEDRRRYFDIERALASFDEGGRMCGVARSFPTEMTVPGGVVPAAAVSAVGVLPTHRRRGHLSGLMRAQLDDVRERGEPVAILIAAEYPIYGRYGYGPAVHACGVRIDAHAQWRAAPTGEVELVRNEDFAEAAATVYDRARRAIPGHISQTDVYWDWIAGIADLHDGDDTARRDAPKVVWYDGDGVPQGVATYTVSGDWVRNRPTGELSTSLVVSATWEAERELFRYLTSVDWISTVKAGLRPVDDPVPLWLVDGRAAALVDRSDQIWVRVVDTAAALTARRYPVPGRLVLDVVDPRGYAGARVALDAGPDGATVTGTSESAELTVPVDALGAAYLGGTPWTSLVATGWVDEHAAGAAERATAIFSSPRAPWCATTF